MYKVVPGVLELIETYAAKNTDGKVTPSKPGWLIMTDAPGSATKATINAYTPLVAGGLLTSSTPANVLAEVSPTEVFFNVSLTSASALGDLDSIIATSAIASGTYAAEVTYDSGSRAGSGAGISLTVAQSAGNAIVTAIAVTDHGVGYKVGDRLTLTIADSGKTAAYTLTCSVANTTMVRGYATGDTSTSYAGEVAAQIQSEGANGVATIAGSIVAESTNGPAFFKIASVDYTTAGSGYRVNDRIKFTCSTGDNSFVVELRLGEVSLLGYVTLELNQTEMVPFQVTAFKCDESNDGSFVVLM